MEFRLFTELPFKVTFALGLTIILGLLALLVGFAFLSYRKNREHLRRGWFYFLLMLRGIAVMLLLASILNPVVATSARRKKGALVFLVDNSQSMQTRDSSGGAKRVQIARDILFAEDGLDESLREDFEIHCYEFGKGVKRLVRRGTLGKPSETTDLLETIKFAAAFGEGKAASGVVTLSDGQNNVRRDEELLEAKSPFPVFCVGIGRKEIGAASQADVEVSQVLSKRIMMQHTKYALDVSVGKKNLPSSQVTLQIREGDGVVSEQAASMDVSSGSQHVSVELTPKETGLHRFMLTAVPLANEALVANNSRYFTVNVISPGLKVLYFEGRPRWEFKFVRRALETSPDVQLLSMVRTAPDSFYVQGQSEELPSLKGFPGSLESLMKFDVLILGSGGRDILSSGNISDIVKFVDNGKGLLVLGSDDLPSLMGTELEKVLPAAVSQGRVAGASYLRLTAQGKTHPVMKGLEEILGKDSQLSRLKGRSVLGRKKPGAVSLATAESQDVILAEQYGKGRVLLFASDSTWEWGLALEGAGYGSAYGRFWQQAARWASGYQIAEEDRAFPIIVFTDKDYYEVGEPVAIEMQSTTPLSEIDVTWTRQGQQEKKVPLTESTDQTGRYFGKLYPGEIGEYQIQVNHKNEKRALWFTVGNPLAETTRVELNDSLLKKIALASGGRYFDTTQKRELLGALRSLAIVRRTTEKQASIWDSPYPFILFVGICALEWFFRRMKQLI